MSSDDEEYDHDYDIEKDCQETFHTTREGICLNFYYYI
jgi:hypothetical protein